MSATKRSELGAPTHSKKWYVDVNDGTEEAPDWVPVNGINNFRQVVSPITKDNSSYASEGWGSNVVTKLNWSLEFKAWRNVDPADAEAYDDGQEILRAAADVLGITGRRQVRWYEMEEDGPRVEAYDGWVSVEWKPDGGSDEDIESVTVTLQGQGKRNAITHPEPNS